MKKIKIRIQGITPLICNKFTDEAALRASSGKNSSFVGEELTDFERASQKLYISEHSGKPILPGVNIFACIVEGGRFHKANKRQVTTQKSSILYGCASIDEIEVEIMDGGVPWKVDTRPVRIPPRTGGRVLMHRPMFEKWELEFTLELDEEIIGPKFLRAIVDDAGKRIGLGDYRPDCKGPYGRFVVKKWEEMN